MLDDDDSLMPTQPLSERDSIEVLARISVTGTANRSEGDLESAPVRVALPSDRAIDLEIAISPP